MCLHLITWYSQHSLIWQLVVKIFFLKPELLEQNWIHEIFCQIALCKFDFMKMFSLEERVLVMVSREMTPKSREILGSQTRFLTFPLCVQGKWPFWLKNFLWKQFHSLITSISHNFCKKDWNWLFCDEPKVLSELNWSDRQTYFAQYGKYEKWDCLLLGM